jgi:HD superfamily phosphohydrolase
MNKIEDKWIFPQKYLWTIRRNQIKDQRLIFFHPIYGRYIMQHFPTAVMLDTFEFNRLHYIKQANLQYLIRPSTTHTRSNHVLGSLTLLSKVLSNIYTNIRRYQPNVANEIIDEIKKYEKHLELALMLHDIGVPPFSHVLEPILEDDIMKKEIGGK